MRFCVATYARLGQGDVSAASPTGYCARQASASLTLGTKKLEEFEHTPDRWERTFEIVAELRNTLDEIGSRPSQSGPEGKVRQRVAANPLFQVDSRDPDLSGHRILGSMAALACLDDNLDAHTLREAALGVQLSTFNDLHPELKVARRQGGLVALKAMAEVSGNTAALAVLGAPTSAHAILEALSTGKPPAMPPPFPGTARCP